MLWLGYICYIVFLITLFTLIIFFFKLTYYLKFLKHLTSTLGTPTVLGPLLFFTFLALSTLYSLIDYNYNFVIVLTPSMLTIFDYSVFNFTTGCLHSNFFFTGIYIFPYVYIFIVVTVLSILFCLAYNTNELTTFLLYVTIILLAGYILFFTNSLILFFFAYEMLLIPSFFILYNFAKTRRCVEAAYLMFFWTQFGALFLIFMFLYIFVITGSSSFTRVNEFYFNTYELNVIFFCLLLGFGVKLPIWPFYGWLPKAHVEASTNFSIFLSGVLVKFAFFGFLKCLILIQLEPTFYFVYPFLTIGITDAVFKLFFQFDLKKLVAYSTVVEMHWLTICVISGQAALMLSAFCMLISHALLSTNSFLLVDAISRRFKTRLITEISGINFLSPKLFLVALLNLLVFLGFPGSIMFISEVLFFSFLFDLFPVLFFYLLILLYLIGPTMFFRTWVNVLFGSSIYLLKRLPTDLSSKELIIYLGLLLLMFWLGFSWQTFLF